MASALEQEEALDPPNDENEAGYLLDMLSRSTHATTPSQRGSQEPMQHGVKRKRSMESGTDTDPYSIAALVNREPMPKRRLSRQQLLDNLGDAIPGHPIRQILTDYGSSRTHSIMDLFESESGPKTAARLRVTLAKLRPTLPEHKPFADQLDQTLARAGVLVGAGRTLAADFMRWMTNEVKEPIGDDFGSIKPRLDEYLKNFFHDKGDKWLVKGVMTRYIAAKRAAAPTDAQPDA